MKTEGWIQSAFTLMMCGWVFFYALLTRRWRERALAAEARNKSIESMRTIHHAAKREEQ